MSFIETCRHYRPFRTGVRIAWPFFLLKQGGNSARQGLGGAGVTRSELVNMFAEEFDCHRALHREMIGATAVARQRARGGKASATQTQSQMTYC